MVLRSTMVAPTTTSPALDAWVTWLRERYCLTERVAATCHTEPAITAELAALYPADPPHAALGALTRPLADLPDPASAVTWGAVKERGTNRQVEADS